jgi:eukaryotic-like serine/threonine-protein kinase
MSQGLSAVSATPSAQNVTTLRALLDQRIQSGERFKLREVVAVVVPLCAEIAAIHSRGEPVYVHPSSIGQGPDGTPHLIASLARNKPTNKRDLAAMAPELASAAPNTRSSVFALGAIVYEMLTLSTIGPGMKPPTQVVPNLPPIVDQILAKALVTNPAQRPDDLPAFAQAIHHFAPSSIAPPPHVDEAAFEVEIDLRSSMLPPSQTAQAAEPVRISAPSDDPFGAVVDVRASQPQNNRPSNSAAEELSALKARLEADPAPRWIVVKDKMDHGPFAAIELLQQIVSNSFKPNDLLVDTHTGDKCPIKDHKEFSRFAHHAHLKREEIAEQKAVVVAEKREAVAAAGKTTIGILAVAGVLTVAGLVFWRIQAKRAEDAKRRADEEAMSIAGEGSVAAAKKAQAPKVGGGGGGGAWGGKSYDDALKNSVSDFEAETLSMKECAAPVGGDIAASCGLNGTATAKIVVKNGRAAGVTVTTDPSQPGVNSCMAGRISGLSWRSVPGATGCIRTFKAH